MMPSAIGWSGTSTTERSNRLSHSKSNWGLLERLPSGRVRRTLQRWSPPWPRPPNKRSTVCAAVAHGIYPPLLEAEGLEAALGAAKRTLPVPVEITCAGLDRYDRSLEESLYFCVLGTVTVAVDVGATRIEMDIVGEDGWVQFMVRCDGAIGDLVSVDDRVDAMGGVLEVVSTQGGSEVLGRLPTTIGTWELV